MRAPVLPTVSLYLGVAAVVLIPFGFAVDTAATLMSLMSKSVELVMVVIGGLCFTSSPGFAIAAIITGHVSRRRHPDKPFGRAGLILGYAGVALAAVTALLLVVAFMSIHARVNS